jgi:hypothetical protein
MFAGADQGAHAEQDEDGAHGGRHATDRGRGDLCRCVAVLERDERRERCAQERCNLHRTVSGADPEPDRQRDQDHDREERVEQAWCADHRLASHPYPVQRRPVRSSRHHHPGFQTEEQSRSVIAHAEASQAVG